MALTPEGKVKAAVSALLAAAENTYYHMPVPSGFGGTTLDYIGSCNGYFFAIETKALGKKPTPRQEIIIKQIERAGGTVFVIDDPKGKEFGALMEFLG